MDKITQIEVVPLSKVKLNDKNPRTIKDHKFQKLMASLKAFPDMLTKRPLVVNKKFEVLGGNMRLTALTELGIKEVPILVADWTKDQEREFMIKDNIGFGDWDWEQLAEDFDIQELTEYGLDVKLDAFLANTSPDVAENIVDEKELKKTQDDLEKQFEEEQKHETIICPSCKHEFPVS